MKIHLKLTRKLYDSMISDLERTHEFAFERVGFAYAKTAILRNGSNHETMLILHDYVPTDDVDYIRDSYVGAKINSDAIRKAMQRILDKNEGCFHVHMHPFGGKLGLSVTDKKGITPLIQSFKFVNQSSGHGILLLGINNLLSYVWFPGTDNPALVSKISIIGYPMKIINQ